MAKTQAPTEKQVRARIVANARWGVREEPAIHYDEVRPIPEKQKPKTVPLTTDCSGFATLCYLWAGAPDPNGLGYNGQGYTGTLLDHGRHIPIGQVQPGDVAIYGTDVVKAGHHAAVVVQVKSPTLAGIVTASHGGERGPLIITCAQEMVYQPPGVVFLRFPVLAQAASAHLPNHVKTGKRVAEPGGSNPQPAWLTKALKSRPKVAWMIWRDNGAPKALRPGNAPRVIPPHWWALYAARRARAART